MTKTYKSSVSKWTYLMFFLVVLIMIIPLITHVLRGDLSVQHLKDTEVLILLGITVLVIGLLLWICFGTYYKIENGYLYHHSGPFYGKIKILTIRKIEYHSGWYVPVFYRPAADTVGLIIKYNRFDDIYFSPKDRDAFVQELLKINPEIEVL